uniref:Glycosyltransferase family 1 protein n=1 Tax=Roseihalotalea indica TaxID=2867963 RepID=A0AA49JK23_9BACT|nr:glycosyltransferase family 1 protein [Tunicatimonas sp. TK19036]
MNVTYFTRKPSAIHFSIETLFKNIIDHLPKDVTPTITEASYVNSGWKNKLYNMFEILLKEQGDVNHITGDDYYKALFMNKSKTVITFHDLNLLYTPNKLKRFIQAWFWLRMPILRSKFVTVVSETTKKEVIKYAKCPPQKIRVIHNCISPAFQPHPKTFNKSYPTILHIGSKPNKNLKGLINAIQDLDCRLEIVGKPTEQEIALLERYKIDYHIQFGLTEKQMVNKYVECDILSFVSLYEGFGLPIVEANMVERVVITSNTSCMPEVAKDAACFVNPHDVTSINQGIKKVIEDDDYRQSLIENGKKNRERFLPTIIADRYFQLYREMIYQEQYQLQA